MWSLLPRKAQLLVLVTAALVIAWAIQAVVEKFTGQSVWIGKWASLTATAIGVVLTGLAKLVWRPMWRLIPALGRWVFPDLNGRWEGTMISTWTNPETGQGVPPIPTVICIRQGLFATHISLQTGESGSHSTRAFLEPARERGAYRVWYSYNNEPEARFRNRSSPHEGVCFLEFETSAPDRLTGRYYTARKTTGDIDVRRVNRDADAPTRGLPERRQ